MKFEKTQLVEIIDENIGDYLEVETERMDFKASFEELGIDSLDKSSILLAIEEKLSIKIKDKDMDILNSFDEIMELINKKY